MEVAGQWRREWAGSAEYGKVTEGGVTRRVARAMEVLHASAPGARVRVMRAAYHSSGGLGTPASSYLMHSSRQVISSGYNFIEPSPISLKPLEISSTPYESSPDKEVEKENYKVTEPDDYDISEPSKWRGSSGNNSIRMPSEESSSTDNASIIDLDSRTSNTLKKAFENKHIGDKNSNHTINTRVSPLLDAPVALSTLKYTSILNSSDEWNNRRKSYSFEDTSPLEQTISPENNFITMDSSTDSGICKSSEIVNDPLNNLINMKQIINLDKQDNDESVSFKDWLSKNRSSSYRDSSLTPTRSYRSIESQDKEEKITLQSSGKVSITLPVESQKSKRIERTIFVDDSDRRTKRVEFCKTELHFAADTGTVNIIATDEKPPPSNDFRRRRSAFVPLNNKIDRSITLFGEKSDFSEIKADQDILNNEVGEADENTAATKSILKNKIPKPKPYLLGENMVFGSLSEDANNVNIDRNLTKKSAVSLINSQFQSERQYSNETIPSGLSEDDTTDSYRTRSKGPQLLCNNHLQVSNDIIDTKPIKKNLGILSVSSEVSKAKVRELKGSDLAYFGIEKNENTKYIQTQDNLQEEIFHSVKLVQQVSNSVCNSEAESDDAPEYQNIPTKNNFLISTPNSRSKYDKNMSKGSEPKVLKSISEQESEQAVLSVIKNNSLKRHKDPLTPLPQSTVESRKTNKEKQCRQKDTKNHEGRDPILIVKMSNNSLKRVKSNKENETSNITRDTTRCKKIESPLYVNINIKTRKESLGSSSDTTFQKAVYLRNSVNNKEFKINKQEISCTKSNSLIKKENGLEKPKDNLRPENKKKYELKQESPQHSQKKHTPKRTEKLATPENSIKRTSQDAKVSINKNNSSHKIQNNDSFKGNKQHKSTKMMLEDKNRNNRKPEAATREKDTIKTTKDLDRYSYPSLTPNENKVSLKPHRDTITSQNTLNVRSNKVNKISDDKLDKSTKSKRSKYVINYDDKNGTVSSICKIKTGPGTYKRKMIPIENKNSQESNIKDKSLNKIALLQLPDRNWNTYNQDYSTRKRKSSAHVQRSCQLL